MARLRDADDDQESEFGLGPGMIDPIRREGRFISAEEELMEIYSLPKTFDKSLDLQGGRPDVAETPVPRLLPGETEADRG